MSDILDTLHKRYHHGCALLGDLHMQRDRLDERIEALTAELRAVQRAADTVPPKAPAIVAATEGKAP